PVAITREVVRRAQAAKRGGRIPFSTSLNATRSEPLHTLYDSSKGAVNALCRQLAVELAPHGFTTAAVAPGLVETPLTDFGLKSSPAERAAVINQIPIRRIATVEDVAWWYVFLASDRAGYSTGRVVLRVTEDAEGPGVAAVADRLQQLHVHLARPDRQNLLPRLVAALRHAVEVECQQVRLHLLEERREAVEVVVPVVQVVDDPNV